MLLLIRCLVVSCCQFFLHLCCREYLCRLFFAGRCLLLKYSPTWRRVARGWPAGSVWIFFPHPRPIFIKLSKYSHAKMHSVMYFHKRYENIKISSKIFQLVIWAQSGFINFNRVLFYSGFQLRIFGE